MATDDFVRNTTEVMLLKNRANADTGPAGKLYYDKATHRLHDMDEWLQSHPAEF